jgi:hypothetical protein
MSVDFTTGPCTTAQGRRAVPWRTVLLLATALAFADGFWLTSLQGAVGAIERAQGPFASWLRESVVALPVFVLAVLAALTLAQRWLGPGPLRPRAVAATALLVAAAATVVGLAEIVASSAYDYHLQLHQLAMMDAMRSICTGSCLAKEQQATLALHVRAVVYVSRWVLVTNLALVAWLVALWGGRLRVATARRPTGRAASGSGVTASRADDVRRLLLAALVGSAVIHAAVVPAHLREWPAAATFFMVLTIWQIAVAGLLLSRIAERAVLVAAALVSLGPLALWLLSRTAGMPFGPDPGVPEAVGVPDLVACALEVVSALAAIVLLRATGRLGRQPPGSAHRRAIVVMTVISLTVVGLAGTGLSWFDAFGVSGAQSVMTMGH